MTVRLAPEPANVRLATGTSAGFDEVADRVSCAAGVCASDTVRFIVPARAILRAVRRRDWRPFVPLSAGIWSTLLIGISFTHALPTGVAIYGLTLVLLNLAVYTHPAPAAPSNRPPRMQARAEWRDSSSPA